MSTKAAYDADVVMYPPEEEEERAKHDALLYLNGTPSSSITELSEPNLGADADADGSDDFFAEDEVKVYCNRWHILFIYFLLSTTNAFVWISFAPIADFTATLYNVTTDGVTWLSLSFLVVYTPGAFDLLLLLSCTYAAFAVHCTAVAVILLDAFIAVVVRFSSARRVPSSFCACSCSVCCATTLGAILASVVLIKYGLRICVVIGSITMVRRPAACCMQCHVMSRRRVQSVIERRQTLRVRVVGDDEHGDDRRTTQSVVFVILRPASNVPLLHVYDVLVLARP